MVMLNCVQDQSEHLVTLQKAFPADTQVISYQWWKRIPAASIRNAQKCQQNKSSIPRHERDHESEPRKCKHPSIYIGWVERWNRTGLLVDWVHVRSFPQESHVQHICW